MWKNRCLQHLPYTYRPLSTLKTAGNGKGKEIPPKACSRRLRYWLTFPLLSLLHLTCNVGMVLEQNMSLVTVSL